MIISIRLRGIAVIEMVELKSEIFSYNIVLGSMEEAFEHC
jgi:hypothetical protein